MPDLRAVTGPLATGTQLQIAPCGAAGMNVCFIPMDVNNPYQRELAAHLVASGVQASGRAQIKGLVAAILRTRKKPAVIHLHWLPRCGPGLLRCGRAVMFYLRMVILRLLGCRVVWTVHNLYSHESSWRWAERILNRVVVGLASRVIVHSETARRRVRHELRVGDRRKIVVVPHGNYIRAYRNSVSKEDARCQLGIDSGAVVLLFFGNVRPYKGVEELISAYQGIRTLRSALVIAGRPLNDALAESIRMAIADDPRIRFSAGLIPDDDVQNYMNASDVVVFPYQDVLTSGAVILAMSFGRACIAPAIGCIPDVLDEKGAFLYDPAESLGLRDAIGRAIQSVDRLRAMGGHNLQRAKEWGWDRVAVETAEVYAAALGRLSSAQGSSGRAFDPT